ncbi:uncharacterized protein LACBIDRAFT_328638 [Laccaria bicolor S238N-H82]|uniref:Predicted protein n=1 Tax=Laccaria bicolor (strain S238N-H82 / ATCC MYA-4686) TaxID=486041 RepID=B0DFI4_LACBS|nr:uncharacterized protein LACBIDRAFT_328638 [Laccaria bicolor S238N-H82]EDR06711.1 predicted protein [Laccaria bicolor S238N-H82]|eukprot:XP_001882558.1 predicted protein [Laccaria bicolor S238N-H82]
MVVVVDRKIRHNDLDIIGSHVFTEFQPLPQIIFTRIWTVVSHFGQNNFMRPILIFFAGHGCETKALLVDNKIQTILPQDYNAKQKKQGHGTPDCTLGPLINGIAKAKGGDIQHSRRWH